MKKKDYQKPTMQVVMLQQRAQLLAGSTPGTASFQNYQNGNFSWDE